MVSHDQAEHVLFVVVGLDVVLRCAVQGPQPLKEVLRSFGEHPGHRVVVRGGAAEAHRQDHADRSGFVKYALVGEQITAFGPQPIGGVTDDRGHVALAQHAYRPRRVSDALQVLAKGRV